MIQLIGPGGAGKTTTGLALAEHLERRFVDLDAEFITRHGDISAFIDSHGYESYAARNVDVCLTVLGDQNPPDIMALSSGFMTYREAAHPEYAVLRQQIVASTHAFVLLPSLDFEACVAETVRRQLQRPFARTPQREEHVIRSRFSTYVDIPARKVETKRPIASVVNEIVANCQKFS